MFLANRPRPWKIFKDKTQVYRIMDANGKFIAHFPYYDATVSDLGYVTEPEALEMAQAFARLSREE